MTPAASRLIRENRMIPTINALAALLTIGFGLFGFLAPSWTATSLDLTTTNSTMGLSEMRASVGGLFVVTGVAVLYLNNPMAYVMLGVVYSGAALGRFVSIALDSPPLIKALTFGGIEAAIAVWLIAVNFSKAS